MSKIVEKTFDASKKIIRSIFKGSPNLFTSSDLNRQVEALKYQLDQLNEKVGATSDMEITTNLSSGTLSVGYSYSYIEVRGCSFSPETNFLDINLTNSAPIAYLCLVADTKEVTYSDDPSHEMSGAVFSDGTSMPSANQLVYYNERVILSHSFLNISNLVAVMAIIELVNDRVSVVKNFITKGKSILFNSIGGTKEPYLYEVKEFDFSVNSFSLPEYIKVSNGDIIEFSIVGGYVGTDRNGYDLDVSNVRIFVSPDENGFSYSPWVPYIGSNFDSGTYQLILQSNNDKQVIVVATKDASRFSKVGKVFVRVYKSGDFK